MSIELNSVYVGCFFDDDLNDSDEFNFGVMFNSARIARINESFGYSAGDEYPVPSDPEEYYGNVIVSFPHLALKA